MSLDTQGKEAQARTALWPNGAPFALFLSHDIDQIHDREMWRIMGDINHIRRMLFVGERGSVPLALRRIMRSLFAPKSATRGFEAILEIEAHFGFRSTFFILHDRYWARHGARYRISDPEIHEIVNLIKKAGCEVGVHGGYYRFNDAVAYRESREVIADAFGVEPVGIRNHYLRLSGPETWRAQAEAGFSYDATFGHSHLLGARSGRCVPFWAVPPSNTGSHDGLMELSLTVMDVTLFRYMNLDGPQALEVAWSSIVPVIEAGGLVTLLWHNNYFGEPEWTSWQWVYDCLLDRLAELGPWCATGEELDRWWRSHCSLQH